MNTVGVVIPCKNYEKFLPECLASLREQHENLRAVIVDDYSSNPFAVRQSAGDTPVIHLPEPRGVGIARNIGAAYLNTNFILFLDADDCLHRLAIANLYALLEEQQGADFAYGNYTQAGTSILTPLWGEASGLLDTQNVASYCNLWRRAAFWKTGGYRGVPVAEDWDLQRRAMREGMIGAHTDSFIFEHRVHDNNKWERDAINFGGLQGVSQWLNQHE